MGPRDIPAPTSGLPAREKARRVALRRKVVLRSGEADGFVIGHAVNVSRTGMFIGCLQPWPPATVFSFEFRLADGDPPVRGKALVTWVRQQKAAAEQPAGMGVEFLELEAEGRRLVDHFVEVESPEGGSGSWSELKGLRATVSQALGGALPEEEPPRAAARLPHGPRTRARPRRRWAVWALAALAVALLAWLAVARPWEAPDVASGDVEPAGSPVVAAEGTAPPAESGTEAAPVASGVEPGEAVAGPGADAAPVAGESPAAELLEAGRESAIALVQDWARAWSAQHADVYLSFYSERYEPPGGQSRAAWESLRRRRIEEPRFLRIAITALEVEPTGPRSYRAEFFQNYRSDRFSDTVRKTLDLEWEAGGWRIVRESAEGT